ncbi:MAG: 4'-phosphopantetheinyl transferase family protein [Planctomycetota bacterium]
MNGVARLVLPEPSVELVLAEQPLGPHDDSALDALHPEEAALARGFASPARRAGFAAGRIALRRALTYAHGEAIARGAVLRDARGRPQLSSDAPPPCSIAHSRMRALAATAGAAFGPGRGQCVGLCVDVEEIEPSRAEALVRMAISAEELGLVRAADAALVAGPLALWCARESCVKAHALEVGWFGTALVARAFERCAPFAEGASDHWRIELSLDGRAPMSAFAWRRDGAVFGAAVSA